MIPVVVESRIFVTRVTINFNMYLSDDRLEFVKWISTNIRHLYAADLLCCCFDSLFDNGAIAIMKTFIQIVAKNFVVVAVILCLEEKHGAQQDSPFHRTWLGFTYRAISIKLNNLPL